MKVCDIAVLQGETLGRKFLSDFIEIFRSSNEPAILETLLTSITKVIKNYWKASTCPKGGWITFPVLSKDSFERLGPWLEYQFPISDSPIHNIFTMLNGFTLSLWINCLLPTKAHHIVSIGNFNTILQLNLASKKQFKIDLVEGSEDSSTIIGQVSH